MAKSIGILPGLAAFFAGVAAGVIASGKRASQGESPRADSDLKSALERLENRVTLQESAAVARFQKVEAKLEEHSARLADTPSTSQIVSAMEELLSKTMSSLDERLNSQARSIETLKTTVAQADGLLERVLESLDSLQTVPEPNAFTEESFLHQNLLPRRDADANAQRKPA
jgi:hypothetical protein